MNRDKQSSTTKQIDSRLDKDIQKTVEDAIKSEEVYKKYIQQERERQKSRKVKSNNIIEDDDITYVDLELSKYEARVDNIKPIESENQFELTLVKNTGDVISSRVNFALPEETGSEWVRLCDWLDICPENPHEIRGEIVPINIKYKDEITIPPVKKGLNPYYYKFKRYFAKKTPSNFSDEERLSLYLIIGFCVSISVSIFSAEYMFNYNQNIAGLLLMLSLVFTVFFFVVLLENMGESLKFIITYIVKPVFRPVYNLATSIKSKLFPKE